MNRPKILVVGDVMLDHYLFGNVTRISPEAPVPVVNATRDDYRPGGAANVAMNLRALGCDCTLMSVMGRDPSRDILMQVLHDIDRVIFHDSNAVTTTKLRVVSGQHIIRIDREELLYESEQLREMASSFVEIVRGFDAVIMSDYNKGVLTNETRTFDMIRAARHAKVPVFVDPKGKDFSRYSGATVITPNISELHDAVGLWSSEDEMLSLAATLRDSLYAKVLLLTRGEHGMTLLVEGCPPITIPTMAREVFDVSGAGDTVVAAFATMFVRGHNWLDAARAANAAAGVVVGKQGTATASWDEIFPGRLLIPTARS